MKFTRTDVGDATTLAIEGNLDINTASELQPAIDQLVADQRKDVTIELGGLDLIDSMGVADIVQIYKRIRYLGGTVKVANIRDQPRAIFKLLRFDKIFDL